MLSANKIRSYVFLSILLLASFALVSLTPILSRSLHPIIPFALFLSWIVVTVFSFGINKLLNDEYKVSSSWLILISWQIILSLIGYSSTDTNVFINRISIYSLPIIGVFCVNYFNAKELKFLFFILFAILLFNLIDNIRLGVLYGIYEDIQIYGYDEFLGTNIGKTNFVACMTFFSGLMLFAFFSINKKNVKFISLSTAICSAIYVIFINPRATATMLLLMLTLCIIYVNVTKRNVRLSRVLILITGIFILIYLIPSLYDGILSILPERTSIRLMSMTQTLEGGDDYSNLSFSSRSDLILLSLHTWLSDPLSVIIGIGEDSTSDGSLASLMKLGIGQHSQFADFLAMYGIVGAVMLFRALQFTYRSIIVNCRDNKKQMQVKILLFVFILESVFNNSLFAGEMFVLAIMLPILLVLINSTEEGEFVQ